MLLSVDDPDDAVGRLAQVIVPDLGDWSFITVIDEDGGLRDIGLAHHDPASADDLRAYSERHLDTMTDVAAVSVGLRTGRPVVVPHLDQDMLATFLPDPEVARLTRRLDPFGVAVFPLQAAGRTFGVVVSATTSSRGSHTPDELATLLEVSRRAGPVLGAARSARRTRMFAETMQRSLLRTAAPGPSLDVAVRYLPAHLDRDVGGDWYDVFSLPDGATVVTIGDVMGHDLAAIAAMAQLRSFMRANAWNLSHSPAGTLAATDAVSAGLRPGTFATVLTAEFASPQPDGSVWMRWSNAGHPPPLLVSPAGEVAFLGGGAQPDPPLGVAPEIRRRDDERPLAPGTVLFLYTDGLVERRDRSIDVGLGELADHLRTARPDDLEKALDEVIAGLGVEGTHDDDIALMIVRVNRR